MWDTAYPPLKRIGKRAQFTSDGTHILSIGDDTVLYYYLFILFFVLYFFSLFSFENIYFLRLNYWMLLPPFLQKKCKLASRAKEREKSMCLPILPCLSWTERMAKNGFLSRYEMKTKWKEKWKRNKKQQQQRKSTRNSCVSRFFLVYRKQKG